MSNNNPPNLKLAHSSSGGSTAPNKKERVSSPRGTASSTPGVKGEVKGRFRVTSKPVSTDALQPQPVLQRRIYQTISFQLLQVDQQIQQVRMLLKQMNVPQQSEETADALSLVEKLYQRILFYKRENEELRRQNEKLEREYAAANKAKP